MNNGKICVSVCAETSEELVKKIRQAEVSADVVEIRFDCLNPEEIEKVLHLISDKRFCSKDLLVTFRIKPQGGKREISDSERDFFWKKVPNHVQVDFEDDFIKKFDPKKYALKICSQHDFEKVPENLLEIYQNLKATNADVVKIAVQTHDLTDTIAIWKLLRTAKQENQKIIPIAMGESGKWTRIMGLSHGALMTYASLDSANETAPGQVSAKDLEEVYRARQLDENTQIYGVLGNNTSVSMSPYIHNETFKFHQLNAVFLPLQVQNIDSFIARMVKPETREIALNFGGFAVTIPHKETVIKHLDGIDDSARTIGAVNTVKIENGKLYGYNTDAHGFIEPLLNSYGDLKDAEIAVLGAGGAARACVYALKQHGANVTIFARDSRKSAALAAEFGVSHREFFVADKKFSFGDYDILVNTTPLGMKGKAEGETPAFADQLHGLHLVYDLIYTPFQTKLLQEADIAEVPKIGGLAMLIAQAMRQQKIWTGLDAPMQEMSRAALRRLS